MMFHTNKKNTTKKTSDDVLQLAIEKANQEKNEMKNDYEKRIQNLQNQANDARVVMQDMVHVARLTPEAFLTLLNQEADAWNIIDLKYIAATIHNRLRYLKEKQARENARDVNAVMPSTAQVLYSYVITDPNPNKTTLVHIITELHKELVPLEEHDEDQCESEEKVQREIQYRRMVDHLPFDEVEKDMKDAVPTLIVVKCSAATRLVRNIQEDDVDDNASTSPTVTSSSDEEEVVEELSKNEKQNSVRLPRRFFNHKKQ